ncbi:MAG: class I SAM-dependent methyltransferase, partial [Desulfovibrio sp.]|nr:class I SAM-dependent methyltransferase [Desulfovibrio sp.]
AMGKIFSGDPEAYRYLADTIEKFPDARTLGQELESAGFVDVRWQKLTWGIAYVHVGVAPQA